MVAAEGGDFVRSLLAASMSILVLVSAYQVNAQSTPSSPNDGETGITIPEIVVTAMKVGAQSLQKVPAAVSAVGVDQLQSQNITGLQTLAPLIPGLAFNQASAAAQIYIRGVGSTNYGPGSDPDVTMQIDGVYIARPSAQLTDFLDAQNVEVLRGPQGTLYGRNAVAGTINVTSRQPSQDFRSEVEVAGGNYDMAQLSGYVSGPLGANLYGSFSAQYLRHDAYWHNIVPGVPDVGNADRGGFRTQLRWEPTDHISATTRIDMELSNEYLQGDSHLAIPAPAAATYSNIALKNWNDVALNTPQPIRTQLGGVAEEVNWAFAPGFNLKSLTAFRYSQYRSLLDSDSTSLNANYLVSSETDHQYSQELDTSYISEHLMGVAGLYYFEDFDTQDTTITLPTNRVPINHSSFPEVDTRSVAGFAQGTYNFTPQWSLVIGTRYTRDTKNIDQHDDGFVLTPGTLVSTAVRTAGNPIFYDVGHEYNALTPKFGINYQVTQDALFFVAATKGFKSGGFNYAGVSPITGAFEPEKIWSYEGGAKTEWFDHRVRINADAFYYDYTNLQVQQLVGPGNVQIGNAATARVKGVEFETITKPIPSLTVTTNVSLLDASYGHFAEASVPTSLVPLLANEFCTGRGPTLTCTENASAKYLDNAPKYSGYLGVDYTHPIRDYNVTGHLDFGWKSRAYFDPSNVFALSQSSYGVANAYVSLFPGGRRWTAQLFVNNLMDRHYLVAANGAGVVPDGVAGDPRTYGVRLFCRW